MSRLRKSWVHLILLLYLFSLFSSCFFHPSSRREEVIMGSNNEIIIAGKTRPERERILAGAFDILRDIDQKMSLFKPASDVSRVNAQGFEIPQKVSGETFEVIQTAIKFREKTEGVFDITVLPLMKLWGFYGNPEKVPSAEEIQRALELTGTEKIIMDPESLRIGFKQSEMGIDLGGIAKGYACDKVVAYLKQEGIESALVNIGGTIFGLGKSAAGQSWRIGLQHPRDLSSAFKIISLENQAVATSGDYEQFFVLHKKRYPHIIDPRTGQSATGSVAVSVIAPSATLADILSTTLFILGPEATRPFMKKFPQVRWYLTCFGKSGSLETIEG